MQTLRQISAHLGGPSRLALAASMMLIPLVMGASAYAQTTELLTEQGTNVAVPVIPQQVRYSGQLATRAGDTVEAVFNIYAAQEGGEPLWTETQQVTVGADSSYTVLLGSATPAGLPQTLFAAGAARWLGVTVERAPELPRVLLSSVPYAMKSADAQALAGHPAGDFVTQEQLSQFAESEADRTPTPAIQPLLSGTITGSGITGKIPQFTGTNTIGDSEIAQVGSDIGISEPAPAATLDVNGTGQFRGTLTMPSVGTATSSVGQQSQKLEWNASVWSSTLGAAISPIYKLYAAGVNNNTADAAATLLFTYQVGTGSPSTILSLNDNGSFVTYGGVTAKTSSLATSSAAVSSPFLGLGASVYNSGSSSALQQNFDWQVIPTGNDTTTPSSNIALLYGSGSAAPAPTGLSISPAGVINWVPSQTFPITGTGGGTITGITTSSPLTGSGTSGSVALGLNTSALETTLNSVYARLGAADVFADSIQASQTAGPSNAAVLGSGTSGSIGLAGISDTGYGVQGTSTSGQGVLGQATTPGAGSSGVMGATGTSFSTTYSDEAAIADAGVWADNSGAGSGVPVGIFGTADAGYASAFINNSVSFPALFVQNNTGVGATINSAGTGDGLDVTSTSAGNGLTATSGSPGETNAGVLGVAVSNSGTFDCCNLYAGVWGDTGTSSTTIAPEWAIGVMGTADDSHAGVFLNDSASWSTLYAENSDDSGITGLSTSIFKTFMATSANGTCGVGGGSMTCTGPIKSLASAGNGARTVETYGVQSPENWMEDFGTGQLEKGVAVVKIDPTFAETVSETADYHVFITPRGDSKGLYVINATPTSFEVRESGGGTSTLSFDYRIVAKRRGYEALRHVDVTESYNAEMRKAKMIRGSGVMHKPAAMAKSPLLTALNSHPRKLVPGRTPVRHQPMTQPETTPTKR